MENAIRFLTTIGVIVIAGIVFSFAQAKEINFGSVADWAGAIANFLVVCVTLWLALSDRRKAAQEDRDNRRRAHAALTSAIDTLLSVRDMVLNDYRDGAVPTARVRKLLAYKVAAAVEDWRFCYPPYLKDQDQAYQAVINAPFHELRDALDFVLAQDELGQASARARLGEVTEIGEVLKGLRAELS